MSSLRLVSAAKREFRAAVEWYLEINIDIATEFVDRVEFAYAQIANNPLRYPKVEFIKTDREIRRVLLPKFPYLIVYELLDEQIYVLAIAHAHRRPGYWKDRKPNES